MTVTVSSGFIAKAGCPYSGTYRGLISCWPGSAGKRNNPGPLLPLLVLFEVPGQRLLVVKKIGPRQLKALFQLVPPAFDIAFQQQILALLRLRLPAAQTFLKPKRLIAFEDGPALKGGTRIIGHWCHSPREVRWRLI